MYSNNNNNNNNINNKEKKKWGHDPHFGVTILYRGVIKKKGACLYFSWVQISMVTPATTPFGVTTHYFGNRRL